MQLHHAVAWIDHHQAQVLRFDAAHVQEQRLDENSCYRRQLGLRVRTDQAFFGELCDALMGVHWVLIAGSPSAQWEFRRFQETYRPGVSPAIVGWETLMYATEHELVLLERRFFGPQGAHQA